MQYSIDLGSYLFTYFLLMYLGDSMEEMEVIAVTTGTKCVNGEHMSVNGNSLNGKL